MKELRRLLLQWWTVSTRYGSVVQYTRSIIGVSSWRPSEQKWHVGIAQHTTDRRFWDPSLECIHDGHWNKQWRGGVAQQTKNRGGHTRTCPLFSITSSVCCMGRQLISNKTWRWYQRGRCSGTRGRGHDRWRVECSVCGSCTARGTSTPVSCCRVGHPFTDHQLTDVPTAKWHTFQWLFSSVSMHYIYILYILYTGIFNM